MPSLGNIAIPEISITGTFPLISEYPHGRAHKPLVVEHRMGPNSANGKVSQRYFIGNGAKEFTVKRTSLTRSKKDELAQFWHDNRGAYGAFYYQAPNEDGTTTEYVCRFKDLDLTFEFLVGAICSIGIDLVEIPTSNPTYSVSAEVLRFPSDALETALAAQVQEIIPLIRIAAKEDSYPVIFISDRRCTVGGDQYEPRLLDWDGIEQSMDGASDQASFVFGNADKVITRLVNEVDLFRADVQFSLYRVGTGEKLDLWRGDVTDWKAGAGSDTFNLSASDGFYELNQMHPPRKVSRTCGKKFADGLNCPFDPEDEENPIGALHETRMWDWSVQAFTDDDSDPQEKDVLYVLQPDAATCDKSWDGKNGCVAHGMEDYFGGIIAHPQGVRTKDNSTGHWGFGRSPMTSTSLIADSIYGEVIPEIYCKITNEDPSIGFPVNCKIAAGRDEGDFYCALGIVGEGPITEYAAPRTEPITLADGSTSLPYNPHKLDGQDHHGFVSDQKNNYGLRLGNVTGVPPTGPDMATHGLDPVPSGASNNFTLGEGGSGITRWGPERAAGTAFMEIRRKDEKGLQLSRLETHAMQTAIRQGLAVWTWTLQEDESYERSEEMVNTTNPIWIAVNVILRAKGLLLADSEDQVEVLDVAAAANFAAICDLEVNKLIGTGTETQFTFTGILQEAKPLRDWLQEILNNCLGYYTFAFDKIKFGMRVNSSAVEQFGDGNIIWGTLEYEPLKPGFWHITGAFADEEFAFVANSVEIYDETYGETVGGVPRKSEMNFVGSSSKSQVARLITTRLREEVGGWRSVTQKVARRGRFKTTLLGLSVEPGAVIRIDHEDLPDYPATADGAVDSEEARTNHVQARVLRWRLNKDYSIDVEWKSLHNEMYDLISGPKPADVGLIPLPQEETFKPANWRFHAYTQRDGLLRLNRIAVGTHKETVHRGAFEVYYCPESTNFYGTIAGSIDEIATTFTMSGHPPIDGRWIMVDSEIMYVERYEPSVDPNFGDVTVRRGQLGTVAVAHTRILCTVEEIDADNNCHLRVQAGLNVRPGSRFVVDDGGGPPFDQQPIASYDNETGDVYTTLPLTTADVEDTLYSDPRLWIIDLMHVEVPFTPRFFSSANRAKWEHTIDCRNAGVVLIKGKLFNTRGISSDPVYCFPASADSMEPATTEEMAEPDFATEFPHRIRTLDGHTFQMPHRDLPFGDARNVFQTVQPAEAQPFDRAYAEVTGGVANAIPTPPTVSAVVPTELRTSGTITLGGEIDEDSMVHVRVEGDNELNVPVWIARDDEDVTTIPLAAAAIKNWLNGGEAFSTYYNAEVDDVTVLITAKGVSGGTIVTDTAGSITATPSGFSSALGVLTGRRYAVAYKAGDYLSALSPLSASTGPTGSAGRIEIKDIPVSSDERVTDVWVYATPDGRDEPLHKLFEIPNGTPYAVDDTDEALLATNDAYPGAAQPPMDGPIIVTLRKNGEEWTRMFIPATSARSNEVHGFALDPIEEGAAITVDVDNRAEVLDLTVNLL